MSNNRWINLAVAYLALVSGFLPYVGWSPSLGAISEDLDLTAAQAGGISSVTGLVAGVLILIGGVISSRYGSKNVILAGLVAGVLGSVVFAMADGFEIVVVARVLAGVSVGLLWVATYTMAVEWFRSDQKTGRALGVMLSGDGAGALLSLFVFSAVLVATGWRSGLIVQAVCLGAVLVIVLMVSKNAPTRNSPSTTDLSPEDPLLAAPSRQLSLRPLASRNVLLAVLFWIGSVGLFSVVAGWMPTLFVEDAKMSETTAGLVTSLLTIASSAAALTSPFLAERFGTKRVILAAGALSAASTAALTFFLSTADFAMVAVFIPLIGLGLGMGASLTLTTAVDSVRAELSGVVNGMVLGIPWILSGFAYPYLLGAVKDATGSFVQGFVFLTVATTVLCAVTPLFTRKVTSDTVTESQVIRSQP